MANCFKCGSDEHLFAACPARAPRRKAAPDAAPQPPAGAAQNGEVKDYDAHLALVEGYVAAWHAGEITTGEKRRAISDENLMHYGDTCRKEFLWDGGARDNTRVGAPPGTIEIIAAETDAAENAAYIRDRMGWSEDRKEQQRREKALEQVSESRSSRLAARLGLPSGARQA